MFEGWVYHSAAQCGIRYRIITVAVESSNSKYLEGLPLMKRHIFRERLLIMGVFAYLFSWAAMNVFIVGGVEREELLIEGPGGKPCLGTLWLPNDPKAVIIVGHGVTVNRGGMATVANAFARNGYAALAIDFRGHGRSRERFDWSSNAGQVNAWYDWAVERYPGLPLAYLGHSMGGAAGDAAFRDSPSVAAFVSMGMLPGRIPECRTLIAMGRFEELFTVEQARRVAQDKADVLVSPFSDHTLEPADPVLIQGIITWVNSALGIEREGVFPWGRWMLTLLAAIIGGAAALLAAEKAAAALRRFAASCCPTPARPPGRFNLFRIAAWMIGCKGDSAPPRSGNLLFAVFRGLVFSLIFVVLMSWILTTNVYTCNLNHPERCIMWLVLGFIMTCLFFLTSRALERIPLHGALQRFAVGALTRATPLLLVCLALMLMGPGIAFAGMMSGILALVFVFIAAIYALAVRGAGDYRSGAVACGIVLAWITAFWFPLIWG